MKNVTFWAAISAGLLVLISLISLVPATYNSFLYKVLNIFDVLAKIGLLIFFTTLYNKQNRKDANGA